MMFISLLLFISNHCRERLLCICCVVPLLTLGCLEDPVYDNSSNITITASAASPTVSETLSGLEPDSIGVDSLHIRSIAVLASSISLDAGSQNTLINAKPIGLLFDPTSVKSIFMQPFSAGEYTSMTMETRRFDAGSQELYKSDPDLYEFAKNDRATIVVNGLSFRNDVATPFSWRLSYNFSVTHNMTPSVVFHPKSSIKFRVEVDPVRLFSRERSIVNPTDTSWNESIRTILPKAITIALQ